MGYLDLLCCPECRGKLKGDKNIKCTSCKAGFQWVDNVLVLLPESKHQIDQKSGSILEKSSRNWGIQWKNASFNPDTNYYSTEKAYNEFIKIKKEEYSGKNVLVLGIGYGKDLYHIRKYKPKCIIAVDICPYIFEARKKIKDKNIIFVRADILDFPFCKGYDVIVSDRVLHHLTDWKKPIADSYNALGKGGLFACCVISKDNNNALKIVKPFRGIINSLPLPILYAASFVFAVALWTYIQLYLALHRLRIVPRDIQNEYW
ncbi:MAG: methyltransferase domain-containing protein, partial [Nanoarchaeota archaeon]|nr:methyltransferase domain-containing protein [Nanoarchaeota archaeon]